MSTLKRDKHGWYYVFDAPRDETGKRRQIKQRGFGSRDEARDALRIAEADALRGLLPSRERPLLAAYLTEWLKDQATRIAPKTEENYRIIIEKHLKPAFPTILLINLTPAMIQRYYREKLESGLAPSTVGNHHCLLAGALNAAVRLQLLYRNPARQVTPPRVPRRNPRVLSREQIDDLLTALRDTDLYLPALLACFAGMREAEILALRWQDLDLEAGVARITGSITHTTAHGTERKSTKTDRSRPVSLAPPAVQALKLHKLSAGSDEYICPAAKGGPRRPVDFANLWRRRMRALGVTITFHELRHSFATLALELGIHPLVVKETLGHSRVSITLDTYSHVQPALHADAAQRIADAITGRKAPHADRQDHA